MSASSECLNCKQPLPPDHSGPCPNCGSDKILKKDEETGKGNDVATFLEKRREYLQEDKTLRIVVRICTFAPPLLGLVIGRIETLVIGLIMGVIADILGPHTIVTVRDRLREPLANR